MRVGATVGVHGPRATVRVDGPLAQLSLGRAGSQRHGLGGELVAVQGEAARQNARRHARGRTAPRTAPRRAAASGGGSGCVGGRGLQWRGVGRHVGERRDELGRRGVGRGEGKAEGLRGEEARRGRRGACTQCRSTRCGPAMCAWPIYVAGPSMWLAQLCVPVSGPSVCPAVRRCGGCAEGVQSVEEVWRRCRGGAEEV